MLLRKKIQKPNVERPRQVGVKTPMPRKTGKLLAWACASFSPVKIRTWQPIQRERQPIGNQDDRQGAPLDTHRPQGEQIKETIAKADLSEGVLKSPESF